MLRKGKVLRGKKYIIKAVLEAAILKTVIENALQGRIG